MKLAIDAMGGDNAPQVNIEGAVQVLSKMNFLKKLFLVGDETTLKQQCDAAGIGSNPKVEIVHAPEVVGMEESGLAAVRQKKNSSMSISVVTSVCKPDSGDSMAQSSPTPFSVDAFTFSFSFIIIFF